MKYLTFLPESIYTIFSNNKFAKINNVETEHLIDSTYFIDRKLIIYYDDLIKNMKIFNLKKFIIFIYSNVNLMILINNP